MKGKKFVLFENKLSNIISESNNLSNCLMEFRIHSPFRNNSKRINNNNNKSNNKPKHFGFNLHKNINLSCSNLNVNINPTIKASNLNSNLQSISNNNNYIFKKVNSIVNIKSLPVLKKIKNNSNPIIKVKNISNIEPNNGNIIYPKINKNKNNYESFISDDNKLKNECSTERVIKNNQYEYKKNKLIFDLYDKKNLFLKDEDKNVISFPIYRRGQKNTLKYIIFKKYKEINDMTNNMVL